ncbi:MAG: bifunctional nuclease family protein [Acidobacteriota bacterium]|nr:MAG: bifunctional nuclease family protein [Acidobacteriota bacterium]
MQIKMSLKGLMVDPVTKTPIVVLRDESGKRILPIWIGIFEANAIALEVEHIKTPRPMTHDLIKSLLQQTGASITKVAITGLVDSTYYALITLDVNGAAVEMDSRPSDAIALALRAGAPIYADEEVLEKSKTMAVKDDQERSERIRKWLESLDPEDLGKYEM